MNLKRQEHTPLLDAIKNMSNQSLSLLMFQDIKWAR